MKAITILQPWASLIACGAKRIETRSWATNYRGPIAIHAGKDCDKKGDRIRHVVFKAEQFGIKVPELQFGAVIAIAELIECVKVNGRLTLKIGNEKREGVCLENGMKVKGAELEFGDFTLGRYAWILANVRQVEPVPAKGMQRIWEWRWCPGSVGCIDHIIKNMQAEKPQCKHENIIAYVSSFEGEYICVDCGKRGRDDV